ncbi:MAG: hypothetical protein FJZ61_05745, partial [Chlamydiae bacterium]|nr:hypothetical protein [Chlamydiota bacterium]
MTTQPKTPFDSLVQTIAVWENKCTSLGKQLTELKASNTAVSALFAEATAQKKDLLAANQGYQEQVTRLQGQVTQLEVELHASQATNVALNLAKLASDLTADGAYARAAVGKLEFSTANALLVSENDRLSQKNQQLEAELASNIVLEGVLSGVISRVATQENDRLSQKNQQLEADVKRLQLGVATSVSNKVLQDVLSRVKSQFANPSVATQTEPPVSATAVATQTEPPVSATAVATQTEPPVSATAVATQT